MAGAVVGLLLFALALALLALTLWWMRHRIT